MNKKNFYNSRIKKLKKLFHISNQLIKEYGVGYFLRVTLEEIFKQKLKLFSSDTVSLDIKNNFIMDYDDLVESFQIDKNQLMQNINTFSILPLFSLVLFIDKKTPSINKILKTQTYENLEFILIASNEKLIKNYVSENRIHNYKIIMSAKIDDILTISEGDYLVFLDVNSILQCDFLFNVVQKINQHFIGDVYYFDEDYIKTNKRINPFFKPDWSPYLLRSFNYIGNSFVINKQLLNKLPNFVCSTTSHYDLLLHCAEISDKFIHISIPCHSVLQYHTFDYVEILSQHIKRLGLHAVVEYGYAPNTYRIHYKLENEPKVSIIIPTKNNKSLLKRCIESIENNTNYKNFEILIIDNHSSDKDTLEYYVTLDYDIISYSEPFNFSKMNNLGASKVKCDYILCLNDDTKVINSDWLTEMVSICQQNDVGIVGAKLLHSNGTIQHAGVTFLRSGSGFHVFENILENDVGFFNLHNVIRDFSAVTGACLLIKKSIFDKIYGYDNEFDLFYGDADLCLKTLHEGIHVVYTPYARLLHDGSTTIKQNSEVFFAVENHYRFTKKWSYLKDGDPFYNNNLGWNFTIAKHAKHDTHSNIF